MTTKVKIKSGRPMPKDKPSPDKVDLRDKVTYPPGGKPKVTYPPGTHPNGKPIGKKPARR